MHVVFAGGGTGGHLFPGLALAGSLRAEAPQCEISFIGTQEGLEAAVIPRAGYRLWTLTVGRGLSLSLRHPFSFLRFFQALGECYRILKRFPADLMISLGGFAAAVPGCIARLLDIPLVLLEQNAIPGRVTRILARWARRIYLQFEEATERLKPTRGEIVVVGSPLRPSFQELASRPPSEGPSLLIIGGSQGAKTLNDLVLTAMPTILRETPCVPLHIAGAMHEESVRKQYERAGLSAEVYGFLEDPVECFSRSRLAIARAGATTLAELAAAGLPALLLPLPWAKDDHQRANARVYANQGAAIFLEETTLTPQRLAEEVIRIWNDNEQRHRMAQAMRSLARPNAGPRIARDLLSWVRERR